MAPKDGDLLDRRIVLAGLSHGETPSEFYYNSDVAFLHFRLKQDSTTRLTEVVGAVQTSATGTGLLAGGLSEVLVDSEKEQPEAGVLR